MLQDELTKQMIGRELARLREQNALLRDALESSNTILEGLKTIVDTKTGYLETSINQDYFDVLIEGNKKLLSDDPTE